MGMIKDPTSWRVGFELGLAGFSFPYSKPRRKPTAYLYNGIRLPALPEWDRGVYPFAYIVWHETTGYTLLCMNEPIEFYTGPGALACFSCNKLFFDVVDGIFVYNSTSSTTDNTGLIYVSTEDAVTWGPHWANTVILYTNGETLYRAADSDPVPVYE